MIILTELTHEAVAVEDATAFTVSEPTTVLVSGFSVGESALLWRLGPSGDYKVITDICCSVALSNIPNTYLISETGTYKITKDYTEKVAAIGYVNASNVDIDLLYSFDFSLVRNSFYIGLP